jgi:RimJ/RimL family protein N-acetyltransferase
MSNGEHPPVHAQPILRSGRVYLRPAEQADLPTFVRWLADAETKRSLAIRAPMSLAMEERWFAGLVERQGSGTYHFVICLVDGGRPIGATDLRDIDLENGNAGFGIAIGETRDRNHGYGTEALEAICDFGFGQLRLERIDLDVYDDNPGARRSYEKAGFKLEGRLRRAHFHNGEHVDVLRMALLRDDWLALDRVRSWDLWPGA